MNKSGIIFNIQKYSLHDGPGIRTTVFFKGCPLSCWWCHNPESQNPQIQLMHFSSKCNSCGKCEPKCPTSAITVADGKFSLERSKCIACGKCEDVCTQAAMEITGRNISYEELMKEIKKDQIFYDQSKGGVTFSGGEPLMQPEFLLEALKGCQAVGIHTTVDTCLFAKWSIVEEIAKYTDLFLVDLKHMDSDVHKKYTGVPNEIILENIKKLSDMGKRMFIRIPIIPGVNDSDDVINRTIDFLKGLKFEQVNLLPYHKIGMDKYTRLEEEYKLKDMEEPSMEHMTKLAEVFKNHGIKVKIGG